MRTRMLASAAVLALVLAACGSSDSDSADDAPARSDAAASEHVAGSHDMAGMDHSAGAHDMADMEGMDHSDGSHDMADMDHGADGAAGEVADDKGFSALQNGHHHEIVLKELPPADQAKLDSQLAITREVAEKYATVADAEADGYRRAGPFTPGLGTHYIKMSAEGFNADGVVDEADLRSPMAMVYEGDRPTDKIAGFMYYSGAKSTPEGFVGDNDFWHYHTSICVRFNADGTIDAPYGADVEVDPKLCAKADGRVIQQTQYMVHVWSVPGYEMTDENGGIFGEVNPKLACADGSYHMLPVEQWHEFPLNVCTSNPQ